MLEPLSLPREIVLRASHSVAGTSFGVYANGGIFEADQSGAELKFDRIELFADEHKFLVFPTVIRGKCSIQIGTLHVEFESWNLIADEKVHFKIDLKLERKKESSGSTWTYSTRIDPSQTRFGKVKYRDEIDSRRLTLGWLPKLLDEGALWEDVDVATSPFSDKFAPRGWSKGRLVVSRADVEGVPVLELRFIPKSVERDLRIGSIVVGCHLQELKPKDPLRCEYPELELRQHCVSAWLNGRSSHIWNITVITSVTRLWNDNLVAYRGALETARAGNKASLLPRIENCDKNDRAKCRIE
jgi:hypothetical protein